MSETDSPYDSGKFDLSESADETGRKPDGTPGLTDEENAPRQGTDAPNLDNDGAAPENGREEKSEGKAGSAPSTPSNTLRQAEGRLGGAGEDGEPADGSAHAVDRGPNTTKEAEQSATRDSAEGMTAARTPTGDPSREEPSAEPSAAREPVQEAPGRVAGEPSPTADALRVAEARVGELETALEARDEACARLEARVGELETALEASRRGAAPSDDVRSGRVGTRRETADQFAELSREELEEKVAQQSRQLAEQGEKTFLASDELAVSRRRVAELEDEIATARAFLVQTAGGDGGQLRHVALVDAAQAAIRSVEHEAAAAASAGDGRAGSRMGMTASGVFQRTLNVSRGGGARRDDAEGDSAQTKALKARLGRLEAEAADAGAELQALRAVAREAKTLRGRADAFSSRMLMEKQARAQTEEAVRAEQAKVSALSEHIEKLMTHLKHESAAKAQALAAAKASGLEAEAARKRARAQQQRVRARDRAVREHEEGRRVLEAQLRLMDERYMDLRTTLDQTRLQARRTEQRLSKEVDELMYRLADASQAQERERKRAARTRRASRAGAGSPAQRPAAVTSPATQRGPESPPPVRSPDHGNLAAEGSLRRPQARGSGLAAARHHQLAQSAPTFGAGGGTSGDADAAAGLRTAPRAVRKGHPGAAALPAVGEASFAPGTAAGGFVGAGAAADALAIHRALGLAGTKRQ